MQNSATQQALDGMFRSLLVAHNYSSCHVWSMLILPHVSSMPKLEAAES